MQRNICTIFYSWDNCTMRIRIRKSLPFWSLRTNYFFRLPFMIIHVQCINIILLVNSRVTSPSKFIYCLENNSTWCQKLNYLRQAAIEQSHKHSKGSAHLSDWNWFRSHKKMNNHITSAIMPMCTMYKYIFLCVCSLGVKILNLKGTSV